MKRLAAIGLSVIGLLPETARAADAPSAETILAGTRWMSVGIVARAEDVPLERIVVIRICAIADLAFTMVGDRLTRFNRDGLAGRSQPTSYVKVDSEPGGEGGTLMTLHTSAGDGDMPVRYRIDAAGTLMRVQTNGADGESFMKCERGTPPAVPAAIFPGLPQGTNP